MNVDQIREFFCGKKVLITGHTGFVGAWLSIVLDYFDADLSGFSWIEEKDSLYEKVKEKLRIKNYYGDLRHYRELEDCIDTVRPDIIFHMAAYGFVRECEKKPYLAFSSNIMGTVNLMELARERDYIKSIIVASSDKVYKNSDNQCKLFEEEDILGGIDPYSCSKTCEDLIVQSYYDTYFKNKGKSVSLIRPSNIIGGGDHNLGRLIPSIICSIKNKEEIEIRNPGAFRPWQYIFDVIDAYLNVSISSWDKEILGIYNVGPESDNIRSVGEIAEILARSRGEEQKLRYAGAKGQSAIEKKYLGLAIDKIKKELCWKPSQTLEDTLEDTYTFYERQDKMDTYQLAVEYVEKYFKNRI